MRKICVMLFLAIFLVFLYSSVQAAETAIGEPEYDLGHGWVYGVDYIDAKTEIEENVRNNFHFNVIEEEPENSNRIKSFDISESGDIILNIDNSMLWIINDKGEFEYGYEFDCSEGHGALWCGEYVVFYYVRGDAAMVLSRQGDVLKTYTFTDEFLNKYGHSYWRDVIEAKERSVNGKLYSIEHKTKNGISTQTVVSIDGNGYRKDLFIHSYCTSYEGLITVLVFFMVGFFLFIKYLKHYRGENTI